MKKGLLIGIVILLCLSMLMSCANTRSDKQNTMSGSTLDENALASYTKLVSFKTDGYEQQSVKDFNASLLSEYAELLDAQSTVAMAGLSVDDENYDFITVTLRNSLSELYAEKMNEKAFFSGCVDRGHLSEPLNEMEKVIFEAEGPIYDFWFMVEYYLEYEILSPDTLTVAERNNTFHTFENKLQAYVDGLDETEFDNTITRNLTDRTATILQEITPDGMSISCEINVSSSNERLMIDDFINDEEYQKLLALQFDGYEEMTVAEFRDEVGTKTDTKEYTDLFERLSENTALLNLKDTNEDAEFLFYILPLAGDDWKTRNFSGEVTSPYTGEKARLEYSFALAILDADALTIKDYNDTRLGIMDVMQDTLRNKTKEELRDEAIIKADIQFQVDYLLQNINQTAELSATIEFAYFPLPTAREMQQFSRANEQEETEPRRSEYGTKEDYQALLALKTSDYASMSIADFNAKLLAWADEDFNRMERVDADMLYNDFQVSFSEEERNFIRLTVFLSGTENGKFVQSNFTGSPVEDPVYQESLPQKADKSNYRSPIWCDFSYRFSYHISNRKTLTVGERDRCVGSMITAVEKFWNDTTLDDLLTMTKKDMISRLDSLANEYSTDGIAIIISAEQVHFDHTEENPEIL